MEILLTYFLFHESDDLPLSPSSSFKSYRFVSLIPSLARYLTRSEVFELQLLPPSHSLIFSNALSLFVIRNHEGFLLLLPTRRLPPLLLLLMMMPDLLRFVFQTLLPPLYSFSPLSRPIFILYLLVCVWK